MTREEQILTEETECLTVDDLSYYDEVKVVRVSEAKTAMYRMALEVWKHLEYGGLHDLTERDKEIFDKWYYSEKKQP